MAEAVVTSSQPSRLLYTRGYPRVERRHKNKSKEVETLRYETPTESDTESETESSKEVDECPENVCQPTSVSQSWEEQQYVTPKVDIDTDIVSTTPSSIKSVEHKKRPKQSGLLAIFGPTSPQRAAVVRPATVQRRNTTIPTSNISFVAESHVSSSNVSSSSTNNLKSSLQSRKNSQGVFSTLFGSPSKPLPRPVTCTTCLSDEIPASRSAKLECGHRMCHACLKRIFVLSTQDPQLMPPRCCKDTGIPLKHVERLFNDKFKRTWNNKYKEYTTKNRLYCPTKTCGAWIAPEYIKLDQSVGRRYGICPKCKIKVCKRCGLRWHGNRECKEDADTERLIDMGKELGWQRCYRCRAMVQLSEGCNHMKCRCTAEFCYLCGRKWKTCDCPWFNIPADIDLGRQQPQPAWADFFPVDIRRFRIHGDDGNAVPMPPLIPIIPPPPPPPPGPPPVEPQATLPPPLPSPLAVSLDSMNIREIPSPPNLTQSPTRRRRQYHHHRLDRGPMVIEQQEQEAADEALAQLLQEHEIDVGLGIGHLHILDTEPEYDTVTARRRDRLERRERRRQLAALHEQGDTERYRVNDHSYSD